MAKAKRTGAPVETSIGPDQAIRSAMATRASIDRGERQHAGVLVAVAQRERLRMQPVKHSAELARDQQAIT